MKIKIKPIRILITICLFYVFLFMGNGELYNTHSVPIYYSPYIVAVAAFFLMGKLKIKLSRPLIWRIVMVAFFSASYLWAINKDMAFYGVKTIVLQTIPIIVLSCIMETHKLTIEQCLRIFVVAAAVNCIYVLLKADFSVIAKGERLGVGSINDQWNANGIGMLACFAVIVLIYLHIRTEKKGVKWLSVFLYILFVSVIFLTGSRKAFVFPIVVLAIYSVQGLSKKKIKYVIGFVAVIFLCFYLIMTNDFLYRLIGNRIDSIVELLSGKGGGDKSAQLRTRMVMIGLNAFWNHPLFGVGLGGFARIHGELTGWYVYSHNNFVEILVNCGLVGFLIYHVYPMGTLFLNKVKNNEMRIINALIIALLAISVGMVSYDDGLYQLLLSCILIRRDMVRNDCDLREA